MLDRTTLESTKNSVINSTKQILQKTREHINNVSKVDASPSMVSATSAGMLAFLSAVTALEGGYVSTYLALACTGFEMYAAATQYDGKNENVLKAISVVATPYHMAVDTYKMFSNSKSPRTEQPVASTAINEEADSSLSVVSKPN